MIKRGKKLKYVHSEFCKCAADKRIYKILHPQVQLKTQLKSAEKSTESQLKPAEKPAETSVPGPLNNHEIKLDNQDKLNKLIAEMNQGQVMGATEPPQAPTGAVISSVSEKAPPAPPPAPGASAPGLPASTNVLENSFGTRMMVSMPFEACNLIYKSKRFTLTDEESKELAKMLIEVAKEFGWELVNKWISLAMLLGSFVVIFLKKLNTPESEGKKNVENVDSKKQIPAEKRSEQPAKTAEPDDPLKGFPVVK
jgi:hypothetical protein